MNIFTPDGSILQSYGKENLTSPTAIAIDEEGYSFVVEYNSTSSRLQVFDPDHKLIKTVTGFDCSSGIIMASDGSILVGDYGNCQIRKC